MVKTKFKNNFSNSKLIVEFFCVLLVLACAFPLTNASLNYVTLFGYDPGSGDGQFLTPSGVAVNSSGHVFVVDFQNDTVDIFSKDGAFLGNLGSARGVGGSGPGQFYGPNCIAVNGTGYVYVEDLAIDRMNVFDPCGNYVTSWPTITDVSGIAINSTGYVYVVSPIRSEVCVYDASGNYVRSWGSMGLAEQGWLNSTNVILMTPECIAIDSGGNVYVGDTASPNCAWTGIYMARVDIFTSSGTYLGYFGGNGKGPGQFGGDFNGVQAPCGIAIDKNGYIFATDPFNHRVEVFNSSWAYVTQFSLGSQSYPSGIAIDRNTGTIYITDIVHTAKFGVNMPCIDVISEYGIPEATVIQTCQSSGAAQTSFIVDDTVYFSASNLLGSTSYSVLVVPHQDSWQYGMSIPTPVSSVNVTADSSGNIAATGVYTNAVIGKYDVLLKGATETDSKYNALDLVFANVTVNPFSVSLSPASWTLNVGQSKIFTAIASSTDVSSYQWYLNGTPVGANSASYAFTPSATGAYSIYCDVNDSSAPPFSVASKTAEVTINSALTAPTVSPSATSVDQSQSCSLSFTSVTTGTSPYTYQWFSMAPDASSYSLINGATLSSYDFMTLASTNVGSWHFILQVTDVTGAAVNSTAVLVTVNEPTPTSVPTVYVVSTAPTPIPTTSTAKPTPSPTASVTPTVPPTASGMQRVTSIVVISGNFTTVDQSAVTGVNVKVNGPSLLDGTQLNVTTVAYGNSPPLGTSTLSIGGTVFYDVYVASSNGTLGSDVTVTISISNPSFTSSSVMEYWNGTTWISVSTTFASPDTITATIPASALTGTPIAVGIIEQGTVGLSLVLVFVLGALVATVSVVCVYVFKKKETRT